jgi:hypothetical protein
MAEQIHQAVNYNLPLPAALSKLLVAFTIEFDNEFEKRMINSGFPGVRLSLIVWTNLLRFISEYGISVCELSSLAFASKETIRLELGCLERWGIIFFPQHSFAKDGAIQTNQETIRQKHREGWGSGRGIRLDWIVQLTAIGKTAVKIWPHLFDQTENLWEKRFGNDKINNLKKSLHSIIDQVDIELPEGLPVGLQRIGLSLKLFSFLHWERIIWT